MGQDRARRAKIRAVRVYLDHNGTTPLRADVRERYLELLDGGLGNASATHTSGRRARAVVDEAREQVAAALGVPEEWLIFTSGGTEANNTALRGVLAAAGPGSGLLTSAVEHSSVLETAEVLARAGHAHQTVAVSPSGALDLDDLDRALALAPPRLVSIMAANNETGACTPMDAVAERLATLGKERPVWHSDVVQALGKCPLTLKDWDVDLASLSAHKVGGPIGVGVLVRRPSIALPPLLTGGGQEVGARSGTENVAGIGAAALAIELAVAEQASYAERALELTQRLWQGVRQLAPEARLVGPPLEVKPRLPNTLCVLLEGVDGRSLIARLDLEGVEASLGSACSSGAIEPSHVLLAMGFDEANARAGLRLSLGRTTSHEDVHTAVEKMGKALQGLAATG